MAGNPAARVQKRVHSTCLLAIRHHRQISFDFESYWVRPHQVGLSGKGGDLPAGDGALRLPGFIARWHQRIGLESDLLAELDQYFHPSALQAATGDLFGRIYAFPTGRLASNLPKSDSIPRWRLCFVSAWPTLKRE